MINTAIFNGGRPMSNLRFANDIDLLSCSVSNSKIVPVDLLRVLAHNIVWR